MAKTSKNSSGVGFEKELWEAACILRGNVDASEYKHVILGFIFLKYVSDRFEQRYRELVDEGEGFENEKDEYTKDGIFFVPEQGRWATIKAFSRKPEVGIRIDEAMQAIEKENKRLKGILPQNFARPELDRVRLGNVVDLFTNISMVGPKKGEANENDLLGRTYEYCLKEFAAMEGKQAGKFFTPPSVVRTLVEVLQPLKGKVYDPCCGTGGMVISGGHGNVVLNTSHPIPTLYRSRTKPQFTCSRLKNGRLSKMRLSKSVRKKNGNCTKKA